MTPGSRRGGVGEQRLDRPDGRFEPVEPLADRRQRDPERDVLALVPAGAEAEDEPAAGHVVEDRRRLRERRTGWRNVFDSTAWPTGVPGHAVGERGEQRERLQAGAAVLDRGRR